VNLSRDALVGLEAETGFRAATLEKVLRLGEMAAGIAEHPFVGPRLVLKGGTAIQLALGTPLRLSVDLDLNYVGQLDREEMLRERPEVEAAIDRVARALRYEVGHSTDEHAGRKFYLGYRSHAGTPDRIELDINYQMRQPISATVERELWQPGSAPRATIGCVGDEELWAGKISALLDRTMPRDLFDVANLAERSPHLFGAEPFRKIVVAWCGILPHPLHSYGWNRVDRVDEAAIAEQLVPMLAGDSRPSRQDLAHRCRGVLEPLLEMTESEIEYCDRLQRGELKPELVFGDSDPMVERFRAHPALAWKALNARRHAQGSNARKST
jgi:predicted nucleotidyltransferase component of viral defense system